MTPLEAETQINLAVEKIIQTGFKLVAGRFGDEKCGCAIKAYSLDKGDRALGESTLQHASRHLNVKSKLMWSCVVGFDGRGATTDEKTKEDHAEWFAMGQRIAAKWDVHSNSGIQNLSS